MILVLVSLVGFAFVDDSDLFYTGKTSNATGEELAPEFQGSLDRWASGLIAAEDAIEPGKYFFYLINFVWNGCHWKYCTINGCFAPV